MKTIEFPLAAILWLASAQAIAADPPPPAQSTATDEAAPVTVSVACNDPARRQFDFWLGSWNVHTRDGNLAGTNEIALAQQGCVVHERYATPRGFQGQSLNTWDAGRKVWHQTWVDNTGTLLLLEGGLVDGKMVLEGETTARDGAVTRHRITWTPNADGTVRQFWESTDAAGDWTVAFDGLYRRQD